MKIKLDENLPFRLVNTISRLGHEIDTIPQEGLVGCSDTQAWEMAQKAGCFSVTQDLNFSNINRFIPGTHYGLLLVRLRDPGKHALFRRIQTIFQTENVDGWQGCFVVVTENKICVRYPQKPKDI